MVSPAFETAQDARRILVISLAGIGDTLIATPFIHELRANFPDATIDAFVLWVGSKDLLEGNPHLNAIYQKNLIRDGALKSLPFLLDLRRRRYDISINVHTLGRIHYRAVARFIGARLRLSHEYEHHGWLDRLLVNRTIPQDYAVHSVENNNRLLALLGRKPMLSQHEFEIFLTPAETMWAEEFLAANQLAARRRLGLHIGSGGTKNLRLKRWPFGHWRELIQRLTQSHPGLAILLFGGPEEQKEHEQILGAAQGRRIFAPPTRNLRQAAALLKHLDAFLSVDTALMHLAAAMKVPNQIVIEAPTLNPTNVPWQTNYRVIRNPVVNGRNLDYYRYDGRPIKGTEEELRRCMASITVDEVHAAVSEALR
jgi:ADP-heptose:LPS heptosyltransferase